MGFFDFLKKANVPNGLIELGSKENPVFYSKDEAWEALVSRLCNCPTKEEGYREVKVGPYADAYSAWLYGQTSDTSQRKYVILRLPKNLQKQWYVACIGESEWEELETKRRIERENKERIARIANQIESGG